LGYRKVDIARHAQIFNRSPEAVLKKLQRIGLNVVAGKFDVTATFKRTSAPPSLEEGASLLCGIVKLHPFLDGTMGQVLRLQAFLCGLMGASWRLTG
jgi:hypothetical protein